MTVGITFSKLFSEKIRPLVILSVSPNSNNLNKFTTLRSDSVPSCDSFSRTEDCSRFCDLPRRRRKNQIWLHQFHFFLMCFSYGIKFFCTSKDLQAQ